MTLLRRGSAKHKHTARRAWLSAHPEVYQDIPGIHDDVTLEARVRLDALRDQMDALGFFGAAPQTIQRETIRRLVSELRGEHIGGGW